MDKAYIVTYFSDDKYCRCVCSKDCKKEAINLARSKSKLSKSKASVWKCTGVWRDNEFYSVDSINLCIYENGHRI